MSESDNSALRLVVRGRVQGVGFRPFVHRLAAEHGLAGRVGNTGDGVVIEVEGPGPVLETFAEQILSKAPKASCIERIIREPAVPSGRVGFTIDGAVAADGPLATRVPADLAVCDQCLSEIRSPTDRRHRYPFTNCTRCGPRFTIIEYMPYERRGTGMAIFRMCAECEGEYGEPADRRFHAEPIACPKCGPTLSVSRGLRSLTFHDASIAFAVQVLRAGKIVALEGLGGYQLIAETGNAALLRQSKGRPAKPFAVMVRDLAAAERLAFLDDDERRLLSSPENPIVLVRARPKALRGKVAPGMNTVGLFMSTTPLHALILAEFDRPVIATSCNREGEPMAFDQKQAAIASCGVTDLLVDHDRPIVRRLDDSVVRVIDGGPVVFRMARGYAPLALPHLEEIARNSPPVLALGGHQKNAVAFWTGSQAILGPHVGDLDSAAAREAFTTHVSDMRLLYRFEPDSVACDAHPDYHPTRWARSQPLPTFEVWHHHAHALAVMAECGLLGRETLAFTWDGTGLGTDGTVWGGEALHVTADGFRRVATLRPLALPGGDAAIRRPAHVAFSLLWQLFGNELLQRDEILVRLGIDGDSGRVLRAMVRTGTNIAATSSVGRLFDGVAALLLELPEVSYEGEAAMRLEAVADETADGGYAIRTETRPDGALEGDWRPLLQGLLDDIGRGAPVALMACRFHAALANWVGAIAEKVGLSDVVLGGGCFQNKLLTEQVAQRLRGQGRRVHLPRKVPPGDGGLAVGQLAAALMNAKYLG